MIRNWKYCPLKVVLVIHGGEFLFWLESWNFRAIRRTEKRAHASIESKTSIPASATQLAKLRDAGSNNAYFCGGGPSGGRRNQVDWFRGLVPRIGSLEKRFQDRRRGACSSQTTAAKRTSITRPSTWVAILGQPEWSHMNSVSSSSPPSGLMRPVLIVTCGMDKSPYEILML